MKMKVAFYFKGDNVMYVTELTEMLSKRASGYHVDAVSFGESRQRHVVADFSVHSNAGKPIRFALGKAFCIEVNEIN